MLQNVSTLTVLLVCIISEYAHAASFQWGREKFSSRSKRSTLYRFSVVESWTSVCEEVCRAGYGGPGCGAYCYSHTSFGNNGQSLSSAFQGMCPILCENNLGAGKCSCASSSINDDIISAQNSLCSATCGWRSSLRLTGCSECRNEPFSVTPDSSEMTDDESGDSSDSSELENSTIPNDDMTDGTTYEEDSTTEENSTSSEENSTSSEEDSKESEEDTTTDEDSTEKDLTTEEQTTESTSTTSTTTTTTQPTTTTTKSTTQATTTPNWESMCEALCRNGEGGSFCNCDIPPFF